MIVQCCVCRKIRLNEIWLKVDSATICNKVISHGYCPSCFNAALIEIEAVDTMDNTATVQ